VIHASLERRGFAATHDSPHKFDGKFDWRTHAMKGEGAMVKGAGTYLSTGDGVHRYYKLAFTRAGAREQFVADATYKAMQERYAAMMAQHRELGINKAASRAQLRARMQNLSTEMEEYVARQTEPSPTYHLSVDIEPEQLLDWDKPLSEQSETVKTAATMAIKEIDWPDGAPTLNDRGEDFYRALSNAMNEDRDIGDRFASEALQAAGILGHRMKASTKDGDANPNYVIYDDSKIHTNYVHFDKTKVTPGQTGPVDRKAVEKYLNDVLGNSVRRVWANIMHAGEFDRTATGDVIRISIHSMNPLSVAYHESLHAFMAKLDDMGLKDARKVLEQAGASAPIMNQLRRHLATEPDALKQLDDAEERAAYMYQFWSMNKLDVGPKVDNIFQRIAKFLREVTGLYTNDERAVQIMEYFQSGQFHKDSANPSAVALALEPTRAQRAADQFKTMTKPLGDVSDALMSAGGARLRDTGIPALRELADAMKLKTTSEGKDPGFLPAARMERSRVMNQLGADLRPYTEAAINEALEAMQNGTKAASTAGRTVAMIVNRRLQEMLKYMQDAGVEVKALGMEDGVPYFPRSWDASYISAHQRQFLAMMDKYVLSGAYKGDPKELLKTLMVSDGAEFNIETDRPGMQHAKTRTLKMISHADAAPFMRKDMFQIMNSYVTQATRRAEWARRFADDSQGVRDLIDRAKKQGATPEQIATAQKFVRAVDGTLGDTINPEYRRLMGNMIVYQNIRLLPLAIFSSIVDPMGIIVRGGTVGEAFKTFRRGIRETVKNFQKSPTGDGLTQLAEEIGTIDSATLMHEMGASYSQGMVGDTGRKINDTFFRLNLMEQFNTSMRVGATESALNFIARHATQPGPHSVRFLRELGLDASDVQIVNGRAKVLESEGLTLDQSAKMKAAVNRWVDGAVLRPDAIDKPIWMSDPHFALIAHMKQFVFAFHETILKRVVHEARNGNITPAAGLAAYVPIMIAADYIKDMLVNGGEEPEWKKAWGPGDYVVAGMERAGLFGVGQFGYDAYADMQRGGTGVGALTGPTIEQMGDALQVLGGREQFGRQLIRALPANALYSSALKGEPDAPKIGG
jgi:hypothetical protein